MKILVIIISILLISSCSNNSNVKENQKTMKYRKPLVPVDTTQSLLALQEGTDTYQKKYIDWQIKHNHLVNTLYHGNLAKLEANKKVIKSIIQVFQYIKPSKKKELKMFIANYNRLLTKSKLGGPIRILERKYSVLKQKIKILLNNTTSNS